MAEFLAWSYRRICSNNCTPPRSMVMVFRYGEDVVLAALVKRRRVEDGTPTAQDSVEETDSGVTSMFVSRLLQDPIKPCCPVLHVPHH